MSASREPESSYTTTAIVASSNSATTGFSSDELDAWNALQTGPPKLSRLEESLNKADDHLSSTIAVYDNIKAAVTPEVANAIQKGVHAVLEAVPTLMRALDEVAKVHPFIKGAVLIFQTVYTLEVTRQGNDQKIVSLYLEMREMMYVLIQLKDVKDIEKPGPDGQPIKGRLENLSVKTAQDIKDCAKTCDAYSKKKLVVKFLSGPIWEKKLLGFVDVFYRRRKDFQFSLSIGSAVGIDQANLKLAEIDQKQVVEIFRQLFQKFVTLQQQQVAEFIESKGGRKAALENDNTIQELIEYEDNISMPLGSDTRRGQSAKQKIDPSDLRREVAEDPDQAIKNNAELFDKKFEIQRRQIEAEVARTVRRESDRIISAVTGGRHDRIVDQDLYDVWTDMGWRGSVKARHFVLALRDHFQEKATSDAHEGKSSPDTWALEYINLNNVQPIMEAFDDDSSGFVTVQEVINLTQLRPRDWSLLHWIAYWATGWQMTVTDYCHKIDQIFTAMFSLLKDVLPANRSLVDEYLYSAWDSVAVFTHSVEKVAETESLTARFQPWVTAEEERLKKNLEDIGYNIDAYNTISLITGPGRIEMFICPLFYLILKRHLAIIWLARTHLIGKSELWEGSTTLWYIRRTAYQRAERIKNIFKQQRLDVKFQLKTFASGMFELAAEKRSYAVFRQLPDPVEADERILPGQDLKPEEVLRYPVRAEETIDHSAYDLTVIQTQGQCTGTDAILGTWYGLIFLGEFPYLPQLSFVIERGDDDKDIRGSGLQCRRGTNTLFQLEGHTSVEAEGFFDINFKTISTAGDVSMIFDGKLDVDKGSIRGKWSYGEGDDNEEEGSEGDDGEESEDKDFVFKRSPEFLLFHPAPRAVLGNPARVRWKFALDSVRYHIRRDQWSASFFSHRFRDRKRYIQLATREFYYGKDLDYDQFVELVELYRTFTAADSRFYTSLLTHKVATTYIHLGYTCDGCKCYLGNIRAVCMDCNSERSIDFCEDPACTAVTFGRDDLEKPHLPTHEVFKVFSYLQKRYQGMTERKAKEALKMARELLRQDVDAESGPDTLEDPKPTCSQCKGGVSLSPPSWCCVECPQMFICASCDSKGLNEEHDLTHALVRCQPATEVGMSTEDRLIATENRLITMERRFTNMEEILQNLVAKLEREEKMKLEGRSSPKPDDV